MIVKIIPLLIIIFLIYLGYKRLKALPVKERKAKLTKYAVYVVIGALVLAVVTGKIHWLGAVVAGALGMLKIGASHIMRLLPFLSILRKNKILSDPVFRTPTIEVTLHINEGRLSGTVLSGEFSGKTLDSLSDSELSQLESALQPNDKRAYYLLRVYRQRATSQKQEESYQATDLASPSLEEARLILGLPESFDKKDIDLAYKRLMQKLHPDRGGNDYLASRVNLARDLLIKNLKK